MAKKRYRLGRETDPRRPEDLSPQALALRKAGWSALGRLGSRRVVSKLFPPSTLSFFDARLYPGVTNRVAFTVDDAFCGLDNPGGDMTDEVRALFAEYDARATFFVAGTQCAHTPDARIRALLHDGHELANHGGEDRPYHEESAADFARDLDRTQAVIARYQPEVLPFYRAPHSRLSPAMQQVIAARGMVHVAADAFAHDTWIPDPAFIAETVLAHAESGSIVLVHMPERGVREWNLEAMRRVLEGLRARRFEIDTVSALRASAIPAVQGADW